MSTVQEVGSCSKNGVFGASTYGSKGSYPEGELGIHYDGWLPPTFYLHSGCPGWVSAVLHGSPIVEAPLDNLDTPHFFFFEAVLSFSNIPRMSGLPHFTDGGSRFSENK